MKPRRVLLAHSQNWLGASRLPSLFAKAGCATTLLGLSGTLVSKSRYVDEHVVAPAALDTFVALLEHLITTRGADFDYVQLADDPLLETVARHAGEDWLDRCFPVDHRSGAVETIQSKFRFIAEAKRAGLPLPRSEIVAAGQAIEAAREFGYPVMIKRGEGSGGQGVRKAYSDDDVASAVRDFGDAEINVEEFVDGIEGGTEVLYDRGRTVCSVSLRKRKRYPTAFGPSAIRDIMDAPGLDELIAGCGAITGFHGFAAICWQYQPATGRLALLEMNPRPGSGMHLAPGNAAVFAPGFRAFIEGRSESYRYRPVRPGTRYRMFPQDLQRAIEQRDVPGMCAWIPGLPTARDIPWNDPALLGAQARHILRESLPGVAGGLRKCRAALHVMPAKERVH